MIAVDRGRLSTARRDSQFNRCKYWPKLPRLGKLRCWKPIQPSARSIVSGLFFIFFFFRMKVVWLNRREICFELWFVFGRLCDSLMRKLRSVHRKVRDCRSERESYISTQSLFTRILYTQSVNLSSALLTPPSGHTLCLPYKQILSCGLFMVNSKEQCFSRSSNVLDTCESAFCPVISYVNGKLRRSVVAFHGTVDVANCALSSGQKRRSVAGP